jgi:AmmeMemoRadiSam system protein B
LSIRQPAVAGSFYPASPEELKKTIKNSFLHKRGPGRLPQGVKKDNTISAVVCPHAGYQYSGPCAAHSYFELSKEMLPKTVIMIGPNHTGWGSPVSMYGEGSWQTPLGRVEIDVKLAKELFKNSDIIDYDETAHTREHSLEVQLPFLQYIFDEFKIIPICMRYQDLETSIELGKAIQKTIEKKNVIILASSDLTHQEPQESANKKDRLVINAIKAMDENKLQAEVRENRITTCGYGPISAAIVASKKLGADSAKLLQYYTSGDIINDFRSVVGYAAIKIT